MAEKRRNILEINPREHFAVYGFTRKPFTASSRWIEGTCEIGTYALDELLGTKMRVLHQRKKGRDLFDPAIVLEKAPVEPERVVGAFSEYTSHGGHSVTRARFEKNILAKLHDPQFNADDLRQIQVSLSPPTRGPCDVRTRCGFMPKASSSHRDAFDKA